MDNGEGEASLKAWGEYLHTRESYQYKFVANTWLFEVFVSYFQTFTCQEIM